MADSKETGTEEASIAAYFTFFLTCAALVLSLKMVTLDFLSYFHLWLISQLILLTICVFYNLTKHVVAVQNPVDNWCDSLYSPSASHHHPAPEPERPSPPPPELSESTMDETWKSIMERRNQRPRKQIERAPMADSRELRKLAVAVKKDFASSKKKKAAPLPAPAPQRPEKGEVRRRDVLYDQSEMLIKNHYDYLRVQRQESEKRQFFERLQQQSYS